MGWSDTTTASLYCCSSSLSKDSKRMEGLDFEVRDGGTMHEGKGRGGIQRLEVPQGVLVVFPAA